MQRVTHDLSKFYIILYDQLKRNAMVDGCDFTLSQLLDTVETDIRIKNSLGQLGNLNISGFFYMSVDTCMYLWDEDPGL